MTDTKKAINELQFQLNSKEVKEQHYPVQLSASDAEKILSLLKEQEPVKPKYTPKSIYSWECGVCAEPFDRIANYCPKCGRSVKWE